MTKLKLLVGALAVLIGTAVSFPVHATEKTMTTDANGVGVIEIDKNNQSGELECSYQKFHMSLKYDLRGGRYDEPYIYATSAEYDRVNLSQINTTTFQIPSSFYFQWKAMSRVYTYVRTDDIPNSANFGSALINAAGSSDKVYSFVGRGVSYGEDNRYYATYEGAAEDDGGSIGGIIGGSDIIDADRLLSKNGKFYYLLEEVVIKENLYHIYYLLNDEDLTLLDDEVEDANGDSADAISEQVLANKVYSLSYNRQDYHVVRVGAVQETVQTSNICNMDEALDRCNVKVSLEYTDSTSDYPNYWFTNNIPSSFITGMLNQVASDDILIFPTSGDVRISLENHVGENPKLYFNGSSCVRSGGYELNVSGRDGMMIQSRSFLESYSDDGNAIFVSVFAFEDSIFSYDEVKKEIVISRDGEIYQRKPFAPSFKGIDAYRVQSWHTSDALTAESQLDDMFTGWGYDHYSVGRLDNLLDQTPNRVYPWFVLDGDVVVDGISYHIENKTRNAIDMAGASATVMQSASGSGYSGDFVIPSTITTDWGEVIAVNSVDAQAFRNSEITTIRIPASVPVLKAGTFKDIDTLETVYIDGMQTRMGDAFDKDINLWAYYNSNAYQYYEHDGYGFANNGAGERRAYCDNLAFHLNGGELEDDSISSTCIMQDDEYVYFHQTRLALPNPVRDGYKFVGWYDNEACSGSVFRTILPDTVYSVDENGALHLYAKWQQVKPVIIIPEETDAPSVDELNKTNDTYIEEEARAEEEAEKKHQDEMSEEALRAEAEEQAKQQEAAKQEQAIQEDSNTSASNESLEALSSPTVKLKTVKAKKSRKVVVQFQCSDKIEKYEVQASTSKSFKKKYTKTIRTIKKQATFKKLKKGKVYYVRVRAYVYDSDGEKVYGDWSKVKKVCVK